MYHLKLRIIYYMSQFCYLIGMYHARQFHIWDDRLQYCKRKWDKEIY